MKQVLYTIQSNRPLTADVWEMALTGDTSAITAPGQFINIKLEGLYLRRPISVCNWDETGLTILYKVVGRGTAAMTRLMPGTVLDTLSGLGNGYDLAACPGHVAVVGGGVGVPPMYGLTKALAAAGKAVHAILGFNTRSEVFYEDAFRALGAFVTVTTGVGCYVIMGFVTAALGAADAYACACGPEPMLRAVYGKCQGGQFSFEERMGCGFGACMGCSCETKYGSKRICRDGPVLRREEIIWSLR